MDRHLNCFHMYLQGKLADLLVLSNKAPVWSYENQSYVLNFHGRVTRVRLLLTNISHGLQALFFQASVKNFQMETEPGNVIMQFGRVGTDTFTMDFRWVDHKRWNYSIFLCYKIRFVFSSIRFFFSFNWWVLTHWVYDSLYSCHIKFSFNNNNKIRGYWAVSCNNLSN